MPNLTIKDIARISGCSVSTISRVINDRPDVRPETKEHVLKVMREAGFVPNTNARQLKIQQSRSLVFVVKGTRNLFFSDFLVQLQRAATLYGYNGIVSYLDENANEIDAAEKILREIKPKGMIFLGGSVANFKKGFANITVPSVLTTLVSDELDFPNLSMVGVDDRAAAYTAVDYLIQQGHRKIAVLGGPVTSYPSVMRREGAQQAMQDAGILFSDKLYGLSNYDFESAYHAVNSLLARRADFTALFAMSDVIALGAIRALVSAGLRVPEDVSVIGFDGITMSRYCVPVLTTVVQPSEQISLQSIELLVRQIEHGAPAQTITLQPELQQAAPILIEKGLQAAVTRTVTLAERVEAPVAAGQQLGTLTISANGETLAEIPIIAPEAIERLTWWELTCRLLRRLCMTMPEE